MFYLHFLYFPKFFHPGPSVKRQSGFLIPHINNSNILGSSFNIPYFKVISEDKDYTVIPTFFSNNSMMIQNEYRQENKDSSLIADFGLVNNFKSTETNLAPITTPRVIKAKIEKIGFINPSVIPLP